MKQVSEILKESILKSGLSLYRLEIETGVDRMCITRFLAGKDVVSGNMDKLCEYFGLTLVPVDKKKGY